MDLPPTLNANPHSRYPGYFNSPWPCEDAGPDRLQAYRGFDWPEGQQPTLTHRRTQLSTMVVLGAPGDVYLLTHSALRAKLGLPTHASVERIDPLTLKPIARSPKLAGGPMWPGGLAVHANGLVPVVYGRHAHLLDRDCQVIAHRELLVNEPHNSFVILENGWIVTKNLSRSHPAVLQVLDPLTLNPVCQPIPCKEPSIARLSALGNTVYVAGMRHLYRYTVTTSGQGLERDEGWQPDYMGNAMNTHGWDMVLDGQSAWLMDNGHHRYQMWMLNAGVSKTANRVIRVSLSNAADVQSLEVSGLSGGSVTNPPLFCPQRRVLLAYDSANAVLKAWRVLDGGASWELLWEKSPFGCASHMVLMQGSGVVWVNDYRRFSERVVALNLETGEELARVKTPGMMQGVVFPCPGWNRDLYWVSMDQVCRLSM
ncbi:MAG: hypothetical protein ACK4FF_13125 [Limnobacter sp.]|uniref:hypothetical protein n=1 Tax=Limnobacter sp. TaxID=2003368 RepID=UPI00391ACF9B